MHETKHEREVEALDLVASLRVKLKLRHDLPYIEYDEKLLRLIGVRFGGREWSQEDLALIKLVEGEQEVKLSSVQKVKTLCISRIKNISYNRKIINCTRISDMLSSLLK